MSPAKTPQLPKSTAAAKARRASPAKLFRALADPTRLRILRLLCRGECCVCHLVDVLEAPQPTVSRHLAYLRREGLVAVRKDGLWSHYRLAEPANALHEKVLDCLRCCLDEAPPFARDVAKLAARLGGCCR